MIKIASHISRYSLETIVLVGGGSVMVLELIGARIVAPYLGTSIYVWSALIGVILGALSIGYYFGGSLSSKNPRLAFLTFLLSISSLLILPIPFVKDLILPVVTLAGVKWGSVAAAIILFVPASIVLGMVSPYAVRLKVVAVETSGGAAGKLSALSTIGSIGGTFLAGFYLIPTFGSTNILFGLSFVLATMGLLAGKRLWKCVVVVLILCLAAIHAGLPSAYIAEHDTMYNHIRVAEAFDSNTNQPVRVLYMATEAHSVMFTQKPNEIYSEYLKLYRLDSLFKSDIKNGLVLGGGAYLAPRDFLSRFPNATMDAVEIDPGVTQAARDYFDFTDSPRLTIVHDDARIFLNNNTEKYDVIYGDAFASYYSIPFHLTTTEAIGKISDSLTDDGILVLNVISSLQGKGSVFLGAEYATLKEYFPSIYVFPAHYSNPEDATKLQNIVLVATKNPRTESKADLEARATDEQRKFLEKMWLDSVGPGYDMPVLTDNFAPVDYYISKLL